MPLYKRSVQESIAVLAGEDRPYLMSCYSSRIAGDIPARRDLRGFPDRLGVRISSGFAPSGVMQSITTNVT